MKSSLKNKKLSGLLLIIVISVVGLTAYSHTSRPSSKSASKFPSSTNENIAEPRTPAVVKNEFNKTAFSINEPSSIWVVVNKLRPLNPNGYVPADLIIPDLAKRPNITGDEQQIRSGAGAELERMFDAAKADGINLTIQSGYRSYNFQTNLYNRYVREQGQSTADTQSARPGHSEHQTGLAVDIGGTTNPACNIAECFAITAEGKWAAEHAHEYGFIIRYPETKTPVTGYVYEPWHLRYVGAELARQMHDKNIGTLEDFFNLPAAPNYN